MKIALFFESDARDSQLRLEIRDYGVGFVPQEKMGETARVGLQGMAERVHLLGGKFSLQAAPGEGTGVVAVFPALPVAEEPIASQTP